MKTSDKLFVISTIYLPIMLILLFYTPIQNFYEYDVPLNKSVVVANFEVWMEPDIFEKTKQDKDSTCYVNPHGNIFCYKKPILTEQNIHMASTIIGNNNINGEIHFDRVGFDAGYFTMKNITKIADDRALITFADKNYRIGNKDRTTYHIADKFEFSAVVKKFDTFITHCGNYEGTGATLVQYLGIVTIDGIDYFATWHTVVTSEQGIKCKYPEIIQHSLKHDFGI